MTFWNTLYGGIQALGLGAAFSIGLAVMPAMAGDQAWDCLPTGDPEGVGSVSFNILNYGIDKGEDDPGSEYEYDFTMKMWAERYDPQKPDWTGPLICSHDGSWSEDLPIWDMFTGQFRPYALNRGFILSNLPQNVKVTIIFYAVEGDDFTDDWADFDPDPNSWGTVEITVFPAERKARTMIGERNGTYDVAIGQINRLEGDGRSSWSGDRFRARLDYVVKVDMPPPISPEVLGILQNMVPPVQVLTGVINIEGMCHVYADKAVELNNQAMAYGCGFQWPVWSSDWNHHYSWCVNGNNWQSAGQSNVQRGVDLQQCVAQKGQAGLANPIACAIYAGEATTMATQAQGLNCGYGGSRWSTDYNSHYAWCMSGVASSALLGETIARASMLAACNSK